MSHVPRRRRAVVGVLLAVGVFFAMATAATAAPPGFKPIDPQNWVNPDHMTWADYKKIPNTNWADPAKKIGGVFATQTLPFFDPKVIGLFRDYESAVYRSL